MIASLAARTALLPALALAALLMAPPAKADVPGLKSGLLVLPNLKGATTPKIDPCRFQSCRAVPNQPHPGQRQSTQQRNQANQPQPQQRTPRQP